MYKMQSLCRARIPILPQLWCKDGRRKEGEMKILRTIMAVVLEPFVAVRLVLHYFFPVEGDNWMLILAFILASDILRRFDEWVDEE